MATEKEKAMAIVASLSAKEKAELIREVFPAFEPFYLAAHQALYGWLLGAAFMLKNSTPAGSYEQREMLFDQIMDNVFAADRPLINLLFSTKPENLTKDQLCSLAGRLLIAVGQSLKGQTAPARGHNRHKRR